MKTEHLVAPIIGIPSLLLFIEFTSWQAGLALFALLFANNLSQVKRVGSTDTKGEGS